MSGGNVDRENFQKVKLLTPTALIPVRHGRLNLFEMSIFVNQKQLNNGRTRAKPGTVVSQK